MRVVRATSIAILMVCCASARARAERRGTDRSARMVSTLRSGVPAPRTRLGRGRAHVQDVPRGIEQARPTIDPSSARVLAPRVLGARLRLAPEPVIERASTWSELPEAAVRKRFRPKMMVHPMGFSTGGGGVKLKLRF